MPLTNKSRSRKFLSKLKENPQRHAEYLAKERERYRKRKEAGKLKGIDELSERGKKLKRRQWRVNQRNSRSKNVTLNNILRFNSPPASPENEVNMPGPSNAKERGRKRVRKDRAHAYRTIASLKKALEESKKKCDRTRKKYDRLKRKLSPLKSQSSPASKTPQHLKGMKNVRRTLLFHNALVAGIRCSKKSTHVKKILSHKVLRKYRLLKYATETTGIPYKTISDRSYSKHTPTPTVRFFHEAKKKILTFLVRDDNSRVKAGKKETITRKKIKKQRRLLTDTMKNLHQKFLAESDMKISYSLFCKMRPFWVLSPTQSDRETCLCKTHENLQYKAEQLHKLQVLQTSDLNILWKQITCNEDSKVCMYRECKDCHDKSLLTNIGEPGKQTSWSMWVTRREERESNNGESTYSVQVTKKVEEFGTVEHLLSTFDADLKKGCRHFFNIQHQYKTLHQLRQNLQENEVAVHIDFSENYNCKYSKEVQSVHFGASQRQVTLHTGMVYGSDYKYPFCSISSCNRHDPPAIWAHLKPVLHDVQLCRDKVNSVHFISDGPTTQYRSKKNFYLFSTRLYDLGFARGSWNFLEAGHGKGAADGVGAAIKRTADSIVKKGTDIPDGETLYQQLLMTKTGVKLFLIQEDDVKAEETLGRDDLATIKGTMLLHQLETQRRGQIVCRNVSCFCKKPSQCNCFSPFTVEFLQNLPRSEHKGSPHDVDGLTTVEELTEELKGTWCVVEYDKQPYPGIIQDVPGGEAEVKVMHRIGNNRFFWPALLEDVLWYEQRNIITLIDPPTLVTKRHHQIEKEKWASIVKYLDRKYYV